MGTAWEILVCSVSLEDEGIGGQRDRLETELSAWPGSLGCFQQQEPWVLHAKFVVSAGPSHPSTAIVFECQG